MINQIDSQMKVLAQAKDLSLTTMIAPDIPPWLDGDQRRLQQILVNLVGNRGAYFPSALLCTNGELAYEARAHQELVADDLVVAVLEEVVPLFASLLSLAALRALLASVDAICRASRSAQRSRASI